METHLKIKHKTPCRDCPWRRKAGPGWLGSEQTPEQWAETAHSDAYVECHVNQGKQCAGVAIFRANNCKVPRQRDNMRAKPDHKKVFSSSVEFVEHHRSGGTVSSELS